VSGQDLIPQAEISYDNLTGRGLFLNSCRHYRYGLANYKGRPCQVAQWFDSSGKPSVQKLRFADKSFQILGPGSTVSLFGQDVCQSGGRRIIVTEGELDAIACYQALAGSGWPVVSLPNGASSAAKAVKRSLEFLESYDEIVLCFDQDEAGAKAVEEVRKLFKTGKVRIATLPRKDACEMVQANESADLRQALWRAKKWQPEGLVSGDDIWDRIVNRRIVEGVPYVWSGLQEYLKGRRAKELVLLTSGTGSGKTTIVKHLVGEALESGATVGFVGLEESVYQSAVGLYGIMAGVRVLPDDPLPLTAFAELHDKHGDRLFLYDHFGSVESDNLVSKLRHLVIAEGCDVIVLDHITIAISGLAIEDERKAIDKMMTDLRSLVEETGCTLYLISHLKRSNAGSHEEGLQIRLSDLRGSHSLGQIPDIIVAAERDQQASGRERDCVQLRILKNRPIGLLGLCQTLQYDHVTGRLSPVNENSLEGQEVTIED